MLPIYGPFLTARYAVLRFQQSMSLLLLLLLLFLLFVRYEKVANFWLRIFGTTFLVAPYIISNHSTIAVSLGFKKMFQKNCLYPNIPPYGRYQMRYVRPKKNRVPGRKPDFCFSLNTLLINIKQIWFKGHFALTNLTFNYIIN